MTWKVSEPRDTARRDPGVRGRREVPHPRWAGRRGRLRRPVRDVGVPAGHGTATAVLLCPATERTAAGPVTGDWAEFDTITVGAERIHAVALQVQGLSDIGGYTRFAAGVADAVRTTLAADTPDLRCRALNVAPLSARCALGRVPPGVQVRAGGRCPSTRSPHPGGGQGW